MMPRPLAPSSSDTRSSFPWAVAPPDDPGAPPPAARFISEPLEILLLVSLCLSAAANLALAVLVALS